MESFKKYVTNPKKINIFDFDDTLCFNDSKIRIKDEQGLKEYSPREFHKLNIDYDDTNFEIDFSDFKKLVNPRINKFVVDEFLRRLKDKEDVIVLSARADISPIKQFFEEFNLPKVKIFGDQNKKQFIEQLIDDGYNNIEYFEDNEKFIKDAKLIRDSRKNLKFRIYQIDIHGKINEI